MAAVFAFPSLPLTHSLPPSLSLSISPTYLSRTTHVNNCLSTPTPPSLSPIHPSTYQSNILHTSQHVPDDANRAIRNGLDVGRRDRIRRRQQHVVARAPVVGRAAARVERDAVGGGEGCRDRVVELARESLRGEWKGVLGEGLMVMVME